MRLDTSQLSLNNNNRYTILSRVMDNTSYCDLNNGELLREVIVKIGLERIDTQKRVIVEALLNSGAIELVISLEFARKQGFKLKKIERPIYVRNMDGTFNKEGSIEYIVEVNIYYQRHRERMEIGMIRRQKWNVILECCGLLTIILRSTREQRR